MLVKGNILENLTTHFIIKYILDSRFSSAINLLRISGHLTKMFEAPSILCEVYWPLIGGE